VTVKNPIMKDIHNLETTVLVDMLAKYTEEYTKMLSNKEYSEAFDACKLAIYLLQGEINSRIARSDNISMQAVDMNFNVDNGYSAAI